jgi:hypothetical protein
MHGKALDIKLAVSFAPGAGSTRKALEAAITSLSKMKFVRSRFSDTYSGWKQFSSLESATTNALRVASMVAL